VNDFPVHDIELMRLLDETEAELREDQLGGGGTYVDAHAVKMAELPRHTLALVNVLGHDILLYRHPVIKTNPGKHR
jgi:hypothetical protein